MTELVPQRDGRDCVVCCLAMALGLTYEEILDHLPPGCSYFEETDVGLQTPHAHAILKRNCYGFKFIFPESDPSDGTVMPKVGDEPALITIRSLNREGSTHMVYWDGEELYDPSPGKRVEINSLKPWYAQVVRKITD